MGLIGIRYGSYEGDFTVRFDNLRVSNPHAGGPTIPSWLGFGLTCLLIVASISLMYGTRVLVTAVTTTWNNKLLTFSIILGLLLYGFVIWPHLIAQVSSTVQGPLWSVWWFCVVVAFNVLQTDTRGIMNVVLIVTGVVAALPFIPFAVIYYALKWTVGRISKPKQKEEPGIGDFRISSLRIQIFARLGMYERVTAEYERVVAELRLLQPDAATEKTFADALSKLGWLYYEFGRLEDAEGIYREGVSRGLEPLEHFYNGIGFSVSGQSRHEEALDAYTHAIELSPSQAYLYRNRAINFTQLKRFTEARADCEKALELDPQHSSTPYGLATLLQAEGSYEQAARYYRESIALDSKRADVRLDLGLCLLFLGQGDEARHQYAQGVRLLDALNARRLLKGAIEELEDSMHKIPDLAVAQDILAKLKQRYQRHEHRKNKQ